jgi:hypothetical protein
LATDTDARAATHFEPYVLPSQPQTGAYSIVHRSGTGLHSPAMSPEPHFDSSGNEQYCFSPQRMPAMPPHILPALGVAEFDALGVAEFDALGVAELDALGGGRAVPAALAGGVAGDGEELAVAVASGA